MTYRQEKLIRFLQTNPDKEFTQLEICKGVDGYKWSDDIRNHCKEIWDDVEEINNDPEIETFIRYKKYRAKIANKEETEAMIDKKMKNALIEFNRYWKLTRKYRKNNQYYYEIESELVKFREYFKENE